MVEIAYFFVRNNSFTILHQNIAGLLGKKELIELTLEELLLNNRRFSILCFSETFVKSGNEGNINISGFRLAASYSRTHQKRGGVCILTSHDVQAQQITWVKDFSEDYVFECCGILIEDIKLIIICIYRTPNSPTKIFLHKFNQLLSKLKHKTKYKIVTAGDLNIDILKDNNDSDELKRIVAINNFKLHISLPTRRSSCIDQIISNIPEGIGETHKLGLSDHDTAQSLTFQTKVLNKLPKHWYLKKEITLRKIS